MTRAQEIEGQGGQRPHPVVQMLDALLSRYVFSLFWHHPEVSLFAIDSAPMVIYLIIACLIVPIVGNFVPRAEF